MRRESPQFSPAQRAYDLLRPRPLPYLQVVQAAMAIDACCTIERLADLLESGGRSPAEQEAEVVRIVDDLAADGLLLPSETGQLFAGAATTWRAGPGLAALVESPLGLGRPLRVLMPEQNADALRTILRNLKVRIPTRKADILAAVLEHLSDPDTVAALVEAAPKAIRVELLRQAAGRSDDESGYSRFDRDGYRIQQEAIRWARDRGLIVSTYYGYSFEMPCEVRLALLGQRDQAPFDPEPPELIVRPVDGARLAGFAAAAATDFADHALAILDHVARQPLALLKSGGLGVRELTKLAKATQSEPAVARLVVELAAAAGLLGFSGNQLKVAGAFTTWRDRDPADRLAVLIRAWWSYGGMASRATNGEGGTRPALAEPHDCPLCLSAKHSLVAVLAEADGGVDVGQAGARLRWRDPFAHLEVTAEDDGDPDRDVLILWRELHTLGLAADGALSDVGKAVAKSDWRRVTSLLTAAMPPAADEALFGADLTAYVTGAPTSRVSTLLDSAADREGRGGAVGWRFSPGSVRRALDAGVTADALVAQLESIAGGALPQPLTYLIAEVGAKHGSLRVSDAVSVIRSDDVALLAEVTADRALNKLKLRAVAPTVVVSATPSDELLSALRAAGYLPMPEPGTGGAAGTKSRAAAPPPRARARRRYR